MATVTVHEAKTNLSELLRRVEAGEEIIIARGETPVAILRDYQRENAAARRRAGMGSLAGQFPMPSNGVFFDPLSEDEQEAMFGPHRDIIA